MTGIRFSPGIGAGVSPAELVPLTKETPVNYQRFHPLEVVVVGTGTFAAGGETIWGF
ncbi:MAG: hypothetical protein QOJ54_3670 [Aliidongia sp.]|jgi:hypothetical protein|nr:hypothetical protein [Aliidongia sp.]